MNIYKLNYTDKEVAEIDLIAKGVYTQDLRYEEGIQAVVDIGKIIKVPGTYDNELNVITEPIYYDGYAYDVMCEQDIIFESEIFPIDCKHSFMGYTQDADGPVLEPLNIIQDGKS